MSFMDLDRASVRTGCETEANRAADAELRRRGYVFNASEARWEMHESKAERVFQAVVYAYEGREVPADLLNHGMVRRAIRFRAEHPSAAAVPSSPAQEPKMVNIKDWNGRDWPDGFADIGRCTRCGQHYGGATTGKPPFRCACPDDGVIVFPALSPSSPVADVEVIVNGQPVVVTAGTVRAVIEEAIRRSGQIGAPVAQWELRTTEGDIIPHNLTDGTDYELTPGRRLWLNLGAPSSPVAGSIHRLIEQWRASADWMMGSTKPDEWQRGGSGYLRKCADELEAALSAPSPSAGAAQKNEIKKI